MKSKQIFKICIDTAMVLLLPLLMAYSLVGEAAHEWMGITMFSLFLLHHALNPIWLKNMFKGRCTGIRIFNTGINLLLAAVMLLLPVSGMIMSRHVFTFLDFSGAALSARIIHLLASYWGFVLMSLHLGLHWNMALGMVKKPVHIQHGSKARTIILRTAAFLICAYGIYVFGKQRIGSYLLLQNQFVFFDPSQPKAYFFLQESAMMGLFSILGYYIAKGSKIRAKEME